MRMYGRYIQRRWKYTVIVPVAVLGETLGMPRVVLNHSIRSFLKTKDFGRALRCMNNFAAELTDNVVMWCSLVNIKSAK